ncbi:MAG: hypothetical protein AAFO82_19285 [Bacteroidota bacterium]
MMNLSETDILLLEDYWAGRLKPEAQTALEKRLAEDADFQAAAAEWQLIVQEGLMPPISEQEEIDDIKNRLLSYAKEEVPTTTTKVVESKRFDNNRMLYIGLAIAASVALFLWLNPFGETIQSDPYGEYFTHLPRENANLSNETVDGKKAYDERRYEEAHTALLAEVEAGSDSLNLIYAAIAAIGSKQTESAITILEPLVGQESWKFYQAEIQWYLALAYLKEGAKTKARDLLEYLIETNSMYKDKAEELVTQL